MPVMDPVVASWIKELVLRQNIPLNITEGFLDMLPNEPADSETESSLRVRRGVAQRRLAEGLTRRLVTPYTLGTIEALYALRPLPAAVDAYRVVAVYLAASASDFPRSVSDLWARRIPNLLRSPSAAGLASPSLHAEVSELERSVTNIKLRNGIMERNSRSKALDAMRALLEAEYKDAGPPILELVGEKVLGDGDEDDAESGSQAEAGEDVRGDEAAESGSRAEGTATQTPAQVARQTPPPEAAQNRAMQTPPAVAQNQAAQTPSGEKATEMPPRRKEIHMPPGEIEMMPRRPKIDGSRLGKGTTLTVNEEQGNSNEAMVRDPTARYSRLGKGTISTSNEVIEQDPAARNSQLGKGTTLTSNRVIQRDPEALNNRLGKGTIPTTNEGEGNSSKAMERDPTARDSRLGKGTFSTSNKVIEQDPAARNSQLGKGATPTTNEGGNSSKAMERDPTARDSRLGKGTTQTMNEKEGNSAKAMEEDPTDRTYERGDDLKAKAVCPPTPVANKRRKTRRWSVLEEDTLRSAVRELGKGYWKEILRNHSDVFEGRTEVDLKDKWRNMTR